MPQTRFVLQKALELNHRVIVVVNKIDRPDARLDEVEDEVLELLLELNATDEQLDSPDAVLLRQDRHRFLSPYEPGKDLKPLFDTILDYIPAPEGDESTRRSSFWYPLSTTMIMSAGSAIGRIERGSHPPEPGGDDLQLPR